jgi:glycosyltransferase involved in cell wall biosynthesis
MTEPPLLQVCPNDHPPFLDICTVYAAAAAHIGRQLTTLFLSPANAEPLAGAVYLDCDSLRRTKPVLAAFESAMGSERLADVAAGVALTICHRYRAYRIVRSSPLALSRTVVVAHEFEFFGRRQRRIEQKLFARDVRFAGVSQPVVDELARTVKNPLLLPNGIDLVRAAEQRIGRREALAALELRGEGFNIGVIGRLHPKKQPELALAGMAALREAVPDAHLVFIGDGELKARLQTLAQDLPVSFAGFVADAARYLSALDVLLIPSGAREAFSMVALEAMAAGVAVVAGPTPGPNYVLGDAGHYFADFTAQDLAATVAQVHRFRDQERERESERLARGVARAEDEFSVKALARRLQALL